MRSESLAKHVEDLLHTLDEPVEKLIRNVAKDPTIKQITLKKPRVEEMIMRVDKLESCKKCGQTDTDDGIVLWYDPQDDIFYVECMCCGAKTDRYLNEFAAIDAWNSRNYKEI